MTSTTILLADLLAQGWDVSGEPPKMLSQGLYRADKVQFGDGVGCCVWRHFRLDPEDEGVDVCFDFPFDHLEDLIAILTALRDAPVETLEEEL